MMLNRGRTQDETTVVVADVHADQRDDVRHALEYRGFSIVAEAADAAEAVDAALRYRPQVCLLAVDMPGGGVEAAGRIIAQLPKTKVAILSESPDDELLAAIRAGADGYVLKDTGPDGLSAALRGLVQGEAVLPRASTARLVKELRRLQPSRRRRIRARLLYAPRLVRHFRHRRRSGMGISSAWKSARRRMVDYA
jgi:DNA-binding NarL/FixJ family response regulator